MIAVLARVDTAHVDVRRADTVAALADALDGRDARQILDIGVEVYDVELLELLGAERLDADRHVLQVLRHLLRRDHDLLEGVACSRVRMYERRAAGKDCGDGRGERQPAERRVWTLGQARRGR